MISNLWVAGYAEDPKSGSATMRTGVSGRRPSALEVQAESLLKQAESLERQRKYKEAEAVYRNYVTLESRLHPECSLDGIIARILDLEGQHDQADAYYRKFENAVAKLLPNPITGKVDTHSDTQANKTSSPPAKMTLKAAAKSTPELPAKFTRHAGADKRLIYVVLANGRLLRILQSMPKEQAMKEFDYAGEILGQANETANVIGRSAKIMDMRPLIQDYRTAPPPVPNSKLPKSEGGPVGGEGTAVTGGNTAGTIIDGAELRQLLSKIPKDKAVKKFDFAANHYPDNKLKHVYEKFSADPLPGYTGFASPRDLVPKGYVILDSPEYSALKKMASGK